MLAHVFVCRSRQWLSKLSAVLLSAILLCYQPYYYQPVVEQASLLMSLCAGHASGLALLMSLRAGHASGLALLMSLRAGHALPRWSCGWTKRMRRCSV
jgi:hypothetical protein